MNDYRGNWGEKSRGRIEDIQFIFLLFLVNLYLLVTAEKPLFRYLDARLLDGLLRISLKGKLAGQTETVWLELLEQ